MSRRAPTLDETIPEGYVEIHPATAERYDISDGDSVRVTSRRGSIITKAQVTVRVDRGTLFIPFHFAEAAANVLTNPTYDPISKIPELKVCAVKIEKVS